MSGDEGCTWRYEVEESFVIVGRGVVVIGPYVGEFAVGDSAVVETPMGTLNTHVAGPSVPVPILCTGRTCSRGDAPPVTATPMETSSLTQPA
jgi:hypothetical protein